MQINQVAHFSEAPNVSIERSRLNLSRSRKTSCDVGKLYPFFYEEVLPGDTFDISVNMLARMSTPLFPVMDNAYADIAFFYVPRRITWDKWKQFMGENNSSAWDDNTEYFIPQISSGNAGFVSGSVADHFGMPLYVPDIKVDALPFRGYRLIWNEWYRNQNYVDPKLVNLGSSEVYSTLSDSVAGDLLPVARFRDYFSSALPAPQKGAAVQIPLDGSAPVQAFDDWYDGESALNPVRFAVNNQPASPYFNMLGVQLEENLATGAYEQGELKAAATDDSLEEQYQAQANPINLWANFNQGTGYATVNALRTAFQIQRILEKDARSGSRYAELLRSHFGIVAPDASLQRPEYLGGRRISLAMQQVVQTSSTAGDQPLGGTGAVSKTVDGGHICTKSFTEHGMIIGVYCIRTDRSYQQGIPRQFSRSTRFDFYWPSLAHVGEQAVLNKELYATGTSADGDGLDDEVFGYQEAWAEYRSAFNQVTGAFRTNYSGGQGYNAWHYADWYASRPFASAEWQADQYANVARTLAGYDPEAAAPAPDWMFLCDFYTQVSAARPMPLYSIPGLIDHF